MLTYLSTLRFKTLAKPCTFTPYQTNLSQFSKGYLLPGFGDKKVDRCALYIIRRGG